jgi:DNA-binding transcriptional LysR family regulator
VKGNIRSNSFEFMREALLSGLGLGLRSTWDIGPELKSGALQVVLPEYCGSSNVAIYAVYPCRDFMPEKVSVFIEYLAELYGPEPYWNKGLELDALASKPLRGATRKSAGARTGIESRATASR